MIKVILKIFLTFIFVSQIAFMQMQEEGKKGTIYEQPTGYLMGEVSLKQRFILEKVINPEDYIIGPGDEFYIMIVTDISFDYRTRVNPNGYIVLPGVGKFRLAGMNLKDGVEKVVDIIKNNGYKEAKIIVVLSDIRNFKVQILGAINKPGIYTITPVIRLSELIDQAGGFNNLAKQNEILIFNNNNEVDTVDFTMYLLTGDQENNPFLKECKMIFIPFGSVDSECVEVRGEVYNQGYYVVKNNETLNDFLLRLVNVKPTADLSKVLIRRKVSSEREIIQVSSDNFDDFILQPGDEVDILAMEGVTVLGYVKLPRKYGYIPGLTAHDYIGIAGGVTEKGSLNKVTVIRKNGEIEKGLNVLIERGDIIMVKRNNRDILVGERSSILEITASLMSVFLTYLAATKYYK